VTATASGLYGAWGGRYVPETLMAALDEFESAYRKLRRDRSFRKELDDILKNYVGRPTPLSEALRTLSSELRLQTLTQFEERAARLPVLLTLPMMLFILPCVFIIVGGPAVLQVMKAFG